MARKTNSKTSVKKDQPLSESRAERALAAVRNNFNKQKDNLLIARDSLRKKRLDATKKGTKAVSLLVDKAQNRVATNVLKLDKLSRDLLTIKAQAKAESIIKNIKIYERRALEKLASFEISLLQNAEEDLGLAVDKFKSRWQKKRALLDERKLKARKRKNRSKLKDLEKKTRTEVRSIQRKSNKALNKPVRVPKSPDRPRKKSDSEVSPKKSNASSKTAVVKKKSTTAKGKAVPNKSNKARSGARVAKRRGSPTVKEKSKQTTVAKAPKSSVKSKSKSTSKSN